MTKKIQKNNFCEKDILLLHVPLILDCRRESLNFYAALMPMGFNSMGSELMQKHYEIEIINYGVEKVLDFDFSIADYVKEKGFKIVGLSLHWYVQLYSVLQIAKKIKEKNPGVLIVLGGYTASLFPEQILNEMHFVDMIIKGEGEVPIVELADIVFNNKGDFSVVPNLYWRKNGVIVINENRWVASSQELNYFNFTDAITKIKNIEYCFRIVIGLTCYQGESNFSYNKQITFCLGRGCSGNCVWCGGGQEAQLQISGRNKILQRSPEIVFKELIELKNRYGITSIYFGQDLDPLYQTRFIQLLKMINKYAFKEFTFAYECFGLPTKEFIDLYAGCLRDDSRVMVSPEFFDEELRKKYKSFAYTNKDLYDVLQYMRRKNLRVDVFLATLPEMSNIAKINQDIMAWDIKKDNGKGFGIIEVQNLAIIDIEPYSPWYLHPQKYGIENIKRDFMYYYEYTKSISWKELW